MTRQNFKGLRKALSLVLTLSLLSQSGFAGEIRNVDAQIIDSNYIKDIKWSTSFENTSGFLSNTLASKGTANVSQSIKTDIAGDLSHLIDREKVSGSAAYNSAEVMLNLFDGSTSTKYLTSSNPTEIIVKLKNNTKKVIKSYYLASANDEQNRDPATWVLQGRNSDSDGWTQIDAQSGQTFSSRYEYKQYDLNNNIAYSQYRLYISSNYGGVSLTQLSEFVLSTGEETSIEANPNGMLSQIDLGPAEAWNQKANQGWSGAHSLACVGTHVGNGRAYSYNVIYDNLNITVEGNTNLRYVIFPSMSNGKYYDFEYTQMHMAVDLRFTDGTYLSELNAKDQNGNVVSPQAQGDSRTLTTNQWNEIYSNIGKVANGKVIDEVLVAYDMASHKNSDLATFKTYFDDIEIYNQDTPMYSHLSDYVNILRGSNGNAGFSRGLTVPIVSTPQGFNFWVPATNYRNNYIYDYQSTTFKYMTISHEPSYWVGDRGTWQFMINTSQNASNTSNYSTDNLNGKFSHDNEIAKAHYYKVAFDSNGGDAANSQMELTPTQHGAVVRFTYNNTSNKSVIFDCAYADGGLTYSGNTFTAYSDHKSNGSKRMYVYGEFSETPVATKQNGKNGIASFNSNVVTMKIATSYISYDQAKKNLQLEIGNQSFDQIYGKAQAEWDNQLGIITDVKGATYEQLVTLYSCIYRLYSYPNIMSENTGTNENPVWKYKSPYRDDNAEPVSGLIYINNGFWDTYRTAWSGYTLFSTDKSTDLLNGLVQHYNDQGWVPRWIAPGGTNSMVGTSSDVVFADAIAKGIDFDYEGAYKSALRNAATVSSNLTNGGRNQLAVSNFLGYSPGGGENFSWSMEGYINDYGIAMMAKALADKETNAANKANYLAEYQYYLNRSKNYSLMFNDGGNDISTQWLRGRNHDGGFTTGNYTNGSFDPFFWGSDYTETNAYNMSVSVPQDGVGIANLYGGADQLADKLDTIFNTDGIYNGYNAVNGVGGIHEQKEAREVKLGQYGHSNQPSHHIPYMYLYSSRPWETQKYVRDVLDRCYVGGTFGQGYIGDEDNGEMSAWYIFSALGFYPLTVGSDEFAIGSPLFDEATVNFDNGNKLIVKANYNNRENVYVDSMYVNGEEYNKLFIKYDDIIKGGTIEFNMSSVPNKERGKGEGVDLTTTTTGDNVPEVYVDLTSDADTSGSYGATTFANLTDNSSDTETAIANETVIMYSFDSAKAARMITLTSSASGRTPDKAQIYADNKDDNWVLLGEYKDSSALFFNIWGKYTRPFSISADKVDYYSRYKIVLTGTDAYLAEVELLGYKNDSILRSDLEVAIDMAENIDASGSYVSVRNKLSGAIEKANKVYADIYSSDDAVKEAYQLIDELVDMENGTLEIKAAEHIEAEAFDDKDTKIVNDGSNIGGVKRNTWVKYDSVYFDGEATKVKFRYAGQNSDAGGYAEIYIDKRVGEPVATIELPTTGNNWSGYVTVETDVNYDEAGLHNVYVVFKNDTNQTYVANVDYIEFEVSQISETEKVVVEGYQYSTDRNGFRVISAVESVINDRNVVEYGNIYAIVMDGMNETDMVVGSASPYVAGYSATENAVISANCSASDTHTHYVMTMINNGTTKKAYQQEYKVRSYAKLDDGTYVYGDIESFSIYKIVDYLYQNRMMFTNAKHDFLYNNILLVVDSSYKEVEYDWGNTLVK